MVMVESSVAYRLAADAVLLLHALFVLFVVLGLILIYAGWAFNWSWVRNPWFRMIHICAIGFVVVQAWLSAICPLTNIEMEFRRRAGEATYTGSFIAHWIEAALYYQAPSWVFVVGYTAFGALAAAAWFWVRPRRF